MNIENLEVGLTAFLIIIIIIIIIIISIFVKRHTVVTLRR